MNKMFEINRLKEIVCVSMLLMSFQAAIAADIVIDAGHGGKDPGAVRYYKDKLRLEKDYTLDMSKQLEREFKRKGYSVHMTRRTDKWVSLQSRLNQARRECKRLFLSVHADSSPIASVRGVTSFVAANNRLNGKRSMELARRVQNAFQPIRKTRTERFFVLKNLTCPTLLIEMGFMTNNRDLERLMNVKQRRKMISKLSNVLHDELQKQKKAKQPKKAVPRISKKEKST